MDQLFKLSQSPNDRIDFWIAMAVCFIGLGLVGWYAIHSSEQVPSIEIEKSQSSSDGFKPIAKTAPLTFDPANSTAIASLNLEPNSQHSKSILPPQPKVVQSVRNPSVNNIPAKANQEDKLSKFNMGETIAEEEEEEEEATSITISTEDSSTSAPIDQSFQTEIELEGRESRAVDAVTKGMSAISLNNSEPELPKDEYSNSPSNGQNIGDCKIIIGAFSNQNNEKKVIQNLKAEGYKTFKTPFRGMTRVGIYHDCEAGALATTLAYIQEKYASDAMVVK